MSIDRFGSYFDMKASYYVQCFMVRVGECMHVEVEMDNFSNNCRCSDKNVKINKKTYSYL